MLTWTNPKVIGNLIYFVNPSDQRDAVTQLDEGYKSYDPSGWQEFKGFELEGSKETAFALKFPNDPPMMELSRTTLRGETIVLFKGSWVAVIQPDGSFRVSRMD